LNESPVGLLEGFVWVRKQGQRRCGEKQAHQVVAAPP
jgi:hypothetical protein